MRRITHKVDAARALLRARVAGLAPGVNVAAGVRFGPGVRCRAHPGGRVVLGPGVEVGGGTTLTAAPGAHLEIGPDVFIAGGCIVAAARHVSIGAGSMLAELVSVRDHDHDPAHPPRNGRMLVGEVRIGQRVWLAAKSTVVRSAVSVGDDAVVAAHAVVTRPVDPGWLVAGVPARAVRLARSE